MLKQEPQSLWERRVPIWLSIVSLFIMMFASATASWSHARDLQQDQAVINQRTNDRLDAIEASYGLVKSNRELVNALHEARAGK